jgi:MFS family permease
MIGLPLGLGLSFMISGRIAQEFGWRTALYVAGGPGIILAFLAFFIAEPARGASEKQRVGAQQRAGSPLLLVLGIPTMWWLIASGAIHNFNMYAQGQFLSSFMMRYHGLSIAEAGKINGIVYGLGGLGILFGGWACDLLAKRRISGRLEVATLALLVYVPSWFIALAQPAGNAWAFAGWVLPGIMLSYVYYAGVYAAIQDIIEPALRGTAMAVYFFAMYVLGAALGPVVFGRVSDYFAQRAAEAAGLSQLNDAALAIGLYRAMYLLPSLGILLVLVLFAASRTVTKDYLTLQKWMEVTSQRPVSE